MNIVTGIKAVRVAFVDIFGKNKGIAMGQCTRKDYTHGELTSGILKKMTEGTNTKIDLFPVKVRSSNKIVERTVRKNGKDITKGKVIREKDLLQFNLKSLLKQLKKINSAKEPYDYVNISTSYVLKYEQVEGATAQTLSNPAIRQAFYDKLPLQVKHIITEIEKLTQNGTQVYISSSNKKVGFNALSLAKGVKTAGGKDAVSGEPIKRFSSNSLVESYQPLPVYMSTTDAIGKTTPKNVIKMNDIVPPTGDYAKLSHFELRKKIASKKDYETLKNIIDNLYSSGKFSFDLDFMRFKLPSVVKGTNLEGKIFDISKFKEIFDSKFSDEILEYTFPQGTHCDLSFRQFFDMKNKSKCIVPITQTTKIPNTVSGTSFAAPQALAQNIMERVQTSA